MIIQRRRIGTYWLRECHTHTHLDEHKMTVNILRITHLSSFNVTKPISSIRSNPTSLLFNSQFTFAPPNSLLNRGFRGGIVAMSATPTPGSVQKSEEEWQAILSPEQFRILRLKGTEYVISSLNQSIYLLILIAYEISLYLYENSFILFFIIAYI